MIVIETCPECGHDLVYTMLASNPPIPKKECFNCGWSWTGDKEEVVRVPFGGNSHGPEWEREYLGKWNISDPILNNINFEDALVGNFDKSACANCSANPKNGGDGICFCILGQMVIY